MVRNILVKDLRRAANVMGLTLPLRGIFDDGGGNRALFAIFDGQVPPEGGGGGAKAAEICCRQVLGKVLRNLLSLPADSCTATFVKAALLKTFEDLEKELVIAKCNELLRGASLVLVVGEWLFSAVLGRCGGLLCQQLEGAGASATGPSHGYVGTPLSHGTKFAPGYGAGFMGTPEVKGTELVFEADREPFFILTGCPVREALNVEELTAVGVSYLRRPRASSGEIVARAVRSPGGGNHDAAAVCGFFLPPATPTEGEEGPPAKKQKVEAQKMESVRIRHILVRHKEAKLAVDLKNKPVTRTREEAEVILRAALGELLQDGNHSGDKMWAAKSTPRILTKKDLQKMGKDGFADQVCGLGIAEWSDLLFSEQGAHLVMRIA